MVYMQFGMEIEFRDQRLALASTDRADETRLPCSVIQSWQEIIVVIDAIPDAYTLRNWQSLGYECLEGGRHSMRLLGRWRIVFELDESRIPPVMIVVAIDEYREVFRRVEHGAR
jgi:plasmid maintenance system killer protein